MGRGPCRRGGAVFHLLVSFLRPQQNRCRHQQLGEMRAFLTPCLFPLPPIPSTNSATLKPHPISSLTFKSFSPLSALHPTKGSPPGERLPFNWGEIQWRESGKQWACTAPLPFCCGALFVEGVVKRGKWYRRMGGEGCSRNCVSRCLCLQPVRN